jgi:phosphatidylinositol glycan class B
MMIKKCPAYFTPNIYPCRQIGLLTFGRQLMDISIKSLLKNEKYWLSAAGIMFLLTAVFSVGYHHLDEHYQILEFAGYHLGITPYEHLCWEFPAHMRPGLQPFLAWAVYTCMGFFAEPNPFVVAMLLRFMVAGIYFFLLLKMYALLKKEYGSTQHPQLLLFLLFFTWFGFYAGVRFSSENASTLLMMASFYLIKTPGFTRPWQQFLAGFFMAWAFHCRFQSGFFIAGIAAWGLFVARWNFTICMRMSIGFLAAFALSVLCDRWLYGEWEFPAYHYFAENIIHDKAASFGVWPWYAYADWIFFRGIPPVSLFYLVLTLLFFLIKPFDILTWMCLPFLLIHLWVPHKELRFLFPLIPFAALMTTAAYAKLEERFNLMKTSLFTWSLRLVVFVNIAVSLYIMFLPADTQNNLYRFVYEQCASHTLLVYTGENPYYKAAPIDFYKRSKLEIKPLSANAINKCKETKFLFVTQTKAELDSITRPKKLLYNNFPQLIKKLDFNGISARVKQWEVYEIE